MYSPKQLQKILGSTELQHPGVASVLLKRLRRAVSEHVVLSFPRKVCLRLLEVDGYEQVAGLRGSVVLLQHDHVDEGE